MRSKRKVCIVIGTRAEYGLLYWLMKEIEKDFKINKKIEMLLSIDTAIGIFISRSSTEKLGHN